MLITSQHAEIIHTFSARATPFIVFKNTQPPSQAKRLHYYVTTDLFFLRPLYLFFTNPELKNVLTFCIISIVALIIIIFLYLL
jgi:branched-subunit amino acid transport protein AzlD